MEAHYKIEFIFGESEARIVRTADSAEMLIPLDEPTTEHNFAQTFQELVEAMRESGQAHAGDEISCVTFPEGSTRHYSKGQA